MFNCFYEWMSELNMKANESHMSVFRTRTHNSKLQTVAKCIQRREKKPLLRIYSKCLCMRTESLNSVSRESQWQNMLLEETKVPFNRNFRWNFFPPFRVCAIFCLFYMSAVRLITQSLNLAYAVMTLRIMKGNEHRRRRRSRKMVESKSNCLENLAKLIPKRLRGYCIIWTLSANASLRKCSFDWRFHMARAREQALTAKMT